MNMESGSTELVVEPDLIRKYDVNGPRYTSYPTADRFVEGYGEAQCRDWLRKRNIGGINQPLSIYVHLPFCNTICYYCACNKVVTKDHGRSGKYIKYLAREMALYDELLGDDRTICQMHWGGGTPTFLSREEMRELMDALHSHFLPAPNAEYSIEIDPRKVAPGTMAFLGELGFNRVSIGVQDFDPAVQKAVNRIQTEDETRRAMEEARANGFRSVNMDLIYGLPKQTVAGFESTLDRIIDLSPERVALYNYAHLPTVFKPQRRILQADMPAPEIKLEIFKRAMERLLAAGYTYIGMDHFAKPTDDLAVAQRQGRLHRNFQGYSTHADCDLLAFGISSIGRVGPTYYQNVKTLDEYYDALDWNHLPVLRGIELTQDDLVRRAVIQALICHFKLSTESIELSYLIDFKSYFADELADLERFREEGLVELTPDWITITPRGRLLVRAICMVFDRYLRDNRQRASYSKVI